MEVIKTDSITKTYDSTKALNRVSLTISKGESVALIGENGSGKTTLINTILGLTATDGAPISGSAYLLGAESGTLTKKHRQQIGCISDHTSPMPWAKLIELAQFYSKLYPKWNEELFYTRLEQWELDSSKRLIHMSKGQKRLAEFSLTLATQPEVLFLDEPFNELDPQHRHDLAEILSNEQENRQLTLLYSTHALTEIPAIAERLLMMKKGNLVVDSAIKSLDHTIPETFLSFNKEQAHAK